MNWAKTVIQAEEQGRIMAKAISKQKEASAYTRTNRSFRLEIDLTVAHVDQSLGLGGSGIVYKWLTVEVMAADFTYRIKSPSGVWSEAFAGIVGAALDQHDFINVSVSNAVGLGIAVIQVGWKE